MNDSLSDLTREVLRFRDERAWAQFHTLRQLAAAIAIEAAELQEVLLWKTDQQASDMIKDGVGATRLRHEIADILIYAMLLAATAGIDPAEAVRGKLVHNAEKYPVPESKGRSAKYTDLPSASSSSAT